jgi:hypothetical protein
VPRQRTIPTHEDEPWRNEALCLGQGATGGSPWFSDLTEADAKATCKICPVKLACLGYGLGEADGVWGGLNRVERRQVIRLVREKGLSLGAAATVVLKLNLKTAKPGRRSAEVERALAV